MVCTSKLCVQNLYTSGFSLRRRLGFEFVIDHEHVSTQMLLIASEREFESILFFSACDVLAHV